MACRLFGANLLLEPMLRYCQLGSQEQISTNTNLHQNENIFISENALENDFVCEIAGISSKGISYNIQFSVVFWSFLPNWTLFLKPNNMIWDEFENPYKMYCQVYGFGSQSQ